MTQRARRCILLAEDDAAFRPLVAEELRSAGYDVIEVKHGGELLEYVSESLEANGTRRPPDLIITDVRMPGLSGFDVVLILQMARYVVPVIVMTAFGSAELHAYAAELGAIAVLDKPFDFDDLIRVVTDALR